MDGSRFDALTRGLARVGSRRLLLRTLAVGGVAGLLADRSQRERAAARHRHHRPRACATIDDCHPCQTCQIAAGQTKGWCAPVADGAACGGDCGVCQSGRCRPHDADCDPCDRCDGRTLTCQSRCAPDQSCCNGDCCDTGCTIPDGVCCPSERFCNGHLCCNAGQTCCRDGCCDHACAADGTCAGTCASGVPCGNDCCPHETDICCNNRCYPQGSNPTSCGDVCCVEPNTKCCCDYQCQLQGGDKPSCFAPDYPC